MTILTVETVDYLLGIGAFSITTLLGIVGYFLKQFSSTITDLKVVVEDLKIMVSVDRERFDNFKLSNEERYSVQTKDIDSLYNKVEAIEKEVLVIKTIIKNRKDNV